MKENKRNNKKLIIIGSIIVAVIIFIVCIIQTKSFRYKLASGLLKNKKYESALNIFNNLDDYKDSKNKLKGLITKSSLITSLSQQFLESEGKDGIL